MKIYIAGLGAGNGQLITLAALKAAQSSDIVIVPRSQKEERGIAEGIIECYINNKPIIPVLFPMIRDEATRIRLIKEQLSNTKPIWEEATEIFFPVIGDAMLYSTGEYMLSIMKELVADLEVEFIAGVSAHSLAASYAKRELAMSNEILSIIPGTASTEEVMQILKITKVAAIYKPKALRELVGIIERTGPYKEIIRIDFAGIPNRERIIRGEAALTDIKEYLSIILLWKS